MMVFTPNGLVPWTDDMYVEGQPHPHNWVKTEVNGWEDYACSYCKELFEVSFNWIKHVIPSEVDEDGEPWFPYYNAVLRWYEREEAEITQRERSSIIKLLQNAYAKHADTPLGAGLDYAVALLTGELDETI